MVELRLHKAIAQAGLASRREAERMIQSGRVEVNRRVETRLGVRVDPDRDEVRVDGRRLPARIRPLTLMVNKPRRVLSTAADDRGRTTIMELLGPTASTHGLRRVFHIGRLDYHSEGLLLLTNDGDLAMALTHPSSQVPRTYRARVRGRPTAATLGKLVAGVRLEDGPAAALDVQVVKRNEKSIWVEVSVVEGRNRLVRRMFDALGHPVQRLVRVAYGGLELGDLPTGGVRVLTRAELELLKRWKQSTRAFPRHRRRGRSRSAVRSERS